MSVQEQGDFLKFITSCSRQPLLGFGQLNPRIGIQQTSPWHPGDDPSSTAARLPSAATCMNLLKLPKYDSLEQLREKLLYAVTSNSGFELS
jgi:ubiquitin-protein ligase E3 C